MRPATPHDGPALAGLIGELAAHQGETEFVRATGDSVAAAIRSGEAGFLLAEDDGEPVGYLSWQRRHSIWAAGDYLYLDDLFVRGGRRGQGVGEALMTAFGAMLSEQGLKARWEMAADNLAARRFYERLGARVTEKLIARWAPEPAAQGAVS